MYETAKNNDKKNVRPLKENCGGQTRCRAGQGRKTWRGDVHQPTKENVGCSKMIQSQQCIAMAMKIKSSTTGMENGKEQEDEKRVNRECMHVGTHCMAW